MSLAFSAYSLENEEGYNNSNSDYIDNRNRKPRRNTTQKLREPMSNKIDSSILQKLHNSSNEDDDDQNTYPPKPASAGLERIASQEDKKTSQESMINMTTKNGDIFRVLGSAPQPKEEEFDANDYRNYGDAKSNEDYYKRMLPGYLQNQQQIAQKNIVNKSYYNQDNLNSNIDDNVLLKKMNYMITLLEDQQDERTNNVTEEVILYSFLGIFIIFIADTFVRAGKYVR
jgi:hypothetical protein